MTTVKFHRTLYAGEAIDAAIKRLAHLATFETSEDDAYWVVVVRAASEVLETRLVGELSNFAVGLTAQRGGPAGGQEPQIVGG